METKNTQITQTQSRDPMTLIRNDLEKMSDQFKAALPEHVTPAKFIRVTLTAIQNDSTLLGCERKSLFSSVIRCAQDGLLPDGKEAALVKYGNNVQYMPMIQGIYKRMRNSGEITSLTAEVIYESDNFKYWIDHISGQNLLYEPVLFKKDRGDRIGAFAVCRLKDGGCEIEVMSKDDVYAVRGVSKSKGGPWAGPFENEMWRKTVIRRLSKRLPLSPDLRRFLEQDDEMYDLGKKDKKEESNQVLKMIGAAEDAESYTEYEEVQKPTPPITPVAPKWDTGESPVIPKAEAVFMNEPAPPASKPVVLAKKPAQLTDEDMTSLHKLMEANRVTETELMGYCHTEFRKPFLSINQEEFKRLCKHLSG